MRNKYNEFYLDFINYLKNNEKFGFYCRKEKRNSNI